MNLQFNFGMSVGQRAKWPEKDFSTLGFIEKEEKETKMQTFTMTVMTVIDSHDSVC